MGDVCFICMSVSGEEGEEGTHRSYLRSLACLKAQVAEGQDRYEQRALAEELASRVKSYLRVLPGQGSMVGQAIIHQQPQLTQSCGGG